MKKVILKRLFTRKFLIFFKIGTAQSVLMVTRPSNLVQTSPGTFSDSKKILKLGVEHRHPYGTPEWPTRLLKSPFWPQNTCFVAFFSSKKHVSTKCRRYGHFLMLQMVLNVFGKCYGHVLAPKKFWMSWWHRGYPIETLETHNPG